MPLYEYECDACGHRFEKIQKFSDPPVDTCPKCGGAVHKLMSSPAFQFKGSGFYITDYAKKDQGRGPTRRTQIGRQDGEKADEQRQQSKASAEKARRLRRATASEKSASTPSTSTSSGSTDSSSSTHIHDRHVEASPSKAAGRRG